MIKEELGTLEWHGLMEAIYEEELASKDPRRTESYEEYIRARLEFHAQAIERLQRQAS